METESLFLMDGVKLEALKTDIRSSVDSSLRYFCLFPMLQLIKENCTYGVIIKKSSIRFSHKVIHIHLVPELDAQ